MEHIVNINANADVSEDRMSLIAAAVFLTALSFSGYAILTSVTGRWDRIVAVATDRGAPVERTITLGMPRYTGARVRVVGGVDRAGPWLGASALHGPVSAQLKLAA
jgi:hypothetical protein